jgi:hypothetical protein
MTEEVKLPLETPAETPTAQQDEQPVAGEGMEVKLPELHAGYLVGVQPDGKFVFQALGRCQGLVELMGLHKYAEHRLEIAKDVSQGYGYPALYQQNQQIAQSVQHITELLKVLLNSAMGLKVPQAGGNRIVTP